MPVEKGAVENVELIKKNKKQKRCLPEVGKMDEWKVAMLGFHVSTSKTFISHSLVSASRTSTIVQCQPADMLLCCFHMPTIT